MKILSFIFLFFSIITLPVPGGAQMPDLDGVTIKTYHVSGQTDVQYDNLQGQSFAHPTAEVLLQVFNHATYHRGQYTAQVRRLGRPTVSTDLIAMLWERDGEGSQTVQPVE